MYDDAPHDGQVQRVLPHNTDAERGLLGALLVDNKSYKKIEGYLKPDHFVTIPHKIIFDACQKLIEAGKTANPITLKPYFEQGGHLEEIGGTDYLGSLAASAVTVINAGEYGRIIYDLHLKREIIAIGQDLMNAGYSNDFDVGGDEIAGKYISTLQKMVGCGSKTSLTNREVALKIAENLKTGIPHYPTGLPQLDAAMGGGLFEGKLYGLSARKKSGKTLLAGTISYNLNRSNVPHMVIPMEMGDEEIEQRNIARHLKTNAINFLKPDDSGNLRKQTLKYADEINNNIIYEYIPGGTLQQIKGAISRGIINHGIKGALIDYLQLIQGQHKGESLAEFLSRVPQDLANFCKTEGIWIWINAQQNKLNEVRGGEGLTYACDQYYAMHRHDDDLGKMTGVWLEMQDTRYTINLNVGSEKGGGLDLIKQGPYFEDSTNLEPIYDEDEQQQQGFF